MFLCEKCTKEQDRCTQGLLSSLTPSLPVCPAALQWFLGVGGVGIPVLQDFLGCLFSGGSEKCHHITWELHWACDASLCHFKSQPTASWIQEKVSGPEGAATFLSFHSLFLSNYFSNDSLMQHTIHHLLSLLRFSFFQVNTYRAFQGKFGRLGCLLSPGEHNGCVQWLSV